MSKRLIIIRGLPGSGKSTLAASIIDNYGGGGEICCADDFDVLRINDAHRMCRAKAHKAMENGISPVVIDNTNIQQWHVKPYVEYALTFGYCVNIVQPETDWGWNVEECAKKSSNGVSVQTVGKMFNSWETDFTPRAILQSEFPYAYANTNKRMKI